MKGDFSRLRFDKEMHYSEVLMQQGRVQVDADWNEQQAINKHRIETEALDVIGKCGAPVNNAGFEITAQSNTLKIGKGRYYVDGILCENEDDVKYDSQPDLPDPADILKVLDEKKTGIVYLDVWQRHITALDDPLICEVALGGPDTSTRAKTVWQVKILPIDTSSFKDPLDCDGKYPEWDKLVASSTGTLNARTQPPGSTDNPCLLPPGAGYQRLENQLYRIEIHLGGPPGTATFKWSRDDGSVVTEIEKNSNQKITVHDVGPDDALGFASGQWAEIVDDATELNGQPGQMVQIDKVDPATRVITLKTSPTLVDGQGLPLRNLKLRRWDSEGDLKVEVPISNNGWIPIEGGIQVQFSPGNYATGDYWMIPARTVTGEIEWAPYEIPNSNPIFQPPMGISHHYCRLAIIQRKTEDVLVQDCRTIFPPLTGEPGIHILKVLAGGKPLRNDTEVLVKRLGDGLRIEFDENIDPLTVKGKPTCFITLDMPFPFNSADLELWKKPLIGFQPLILAADVTAKGNVVLWKPTPEAGNWLEERLFDRISKFERGNRILAHLTLKGNFIWAKDNSELYLDGEVFGVIGAGGNTDVQFPSGDRRRGGDFEMWFWLAAVSNGSISGKKTILDFNENESQGKGWEIVLTKPEGTTMKNDTDENGNYSFKDLPPGTYTVAEVLKNGYTPIDPPTGKHEVILAAGDNVTDKNFKNSFPIG